MSYDRMTQDRLLLIQVLQSKLRDMTEHRDAWRVRADYLLWTDQTKRTGDNCPERYLAWETDDEAE